MAKYKTDSQDIYFNLFQVLKVQDRPYGMSENEIKDVLIQLDNFVEKEIYPTRQIGDHEGAKLTPQGVKVPTCLHKATKAFCENGWNVLGLPEDMGGMPISHAAFVSCHSLWVGANVAWSMYPGLTRSAMNVVNMIGTPAQKSLYVPPMVDGRFGGTMCLTEPGAGSDVGALKTTATPTGNGKYKIKGVKIFISSGESDLYSNNIHLVLARTPGAPAGTKGISLFIVPRYRLNADGSVGAANDVVCTKIEEKMGIHAQATSELTFGAHDQCEGELIGKEFEGMTNMFIMMNEARLHCGIQGESQANLAYQLTLQYTKERVQFGKEIIQHPDVKKMMLKMRALCRGMRSLCLYVSDLFDEAHEKPESGAMAEIGFLTPIVKAYCTEKGFHVSVEAIQAHGGYGYCTEYGIEQFSRDIKIATIYEGTNAIQAIDFVTRKILKDKGATFGAVGAKIQKTLASPQVRAWEKEVALIVKSLGEAQKIAEDMGKKAVQDPNYMLQYCSDYLEFCGNLIVGWRLLENARVAQELLTAGKGNPDEKKHYESVVADFKIFAQNFLIHNTAISKGIIDFETRVDKLEI